MANKVEISSKLLDKTKILPQTKQLYLSLLSRGHIKFLRQIYKTYSDLVSTVIPAIITVARNYGPKLLKGSSYVRNSIKSQLKPGQTAVVKFKIDPAIMGGFTLRIGNSELDRSLKPRLDQIYSFFQSQMVQTLGKGEKEFLSLPFLTKSTTELPQPVKLEFKS